MEEGYVGKEFEITKDIEEKQILSLKEFIGL